MRKSEIFTSLGAMTLLALMFSCKGVQSKSNEIPATGEAEIPVTEYVGINSALFADLVYEQSEGPATLRVVGDSAVINKLNVEVRDSVLYLVVQGNVSIPAEAPKTTIYTSSKSLRLLAMDGAGDAVLKGKITGRRIDFRMNGAGDLTAEQLHTETLALSVNGSGDAEVKGKVVAAAYNLNGSGSIDAEDLEVESLRVYLQGSGDVKTRATKLLDANITGSGSVAYIGKPEKLIQNVTGSGAVKQAD